ncbi:NAD(P)-binding domain-containing protein [Pseudomonas aeruginosa]|nr:NAD(P)-binding domain-containing protein [Pseudomonas aeruginosa]
MTAVAFLGLGTMGYPMAGHLQREGYHVCVYNRPRRPRRCAGSRSTPDDTPIRAARGLCRRRTGVLLRR